MQRREFLTALAAGTLLSRAVRSADLPTDLKITRLIGFDVVSQRSKVAGRNAVKDVHGDTGRDGMLRIVTNTGLEGIGNCRANEKDAGQLLGQDPFATFRKEETAFVSPLARGTMPLWDLLGKVTSQPIYKLLGGEGPERVPAYDGSIYFMDLLPQYADKWEARVREEIDMGLARGHRAFKVKIGRGNKWMDRQAGDDRDAAILKIIRDHAGPDVLIGVDANNGYDLAGTKRLFERIGPLDIAFAEEMFPETVEECLEFQEFLGSHGWKTLVADGETQGELEVFKPFIAAKAIEVYQADMNRFGFEGILTEAAWARPQGLQVAPHNWGSLVGFYMQAQVGRAIDNFYRAEQDPLTNRILAADGYTVKDGLATVPDAPGAGLTINEQHFATDAVIRFDLKA
jgi:L-alanine-DL-glutamate epimerase-like enolase superfamily enzyme